MNEIQTRTLHQAREALLVARARCLPAGYYPDTMSARIADSTSLLLAAMAAAKAAAAVLADDTEHAGLTNVLRLAANSRSFILDFPPTELEQAFALVMGPEEQGAPREDSQPEEVSFNE